MAWLGMSNTLPGDGEKPASKHPGARNIQRGKSTPPALPVPIVKQPETPVTLPVPKTPAPTSSTRKTRTKGN